MLAIIIKGTQIQIYYHTMYKQKITDRGIKTILGILGEVFTEVLEAKTKESGKICLRLALRQTL